MIYIFAEVMLYAMTATPDVPQIQAAIDSALFYGSVPLCHGVTRENHLTTIYVRLDVGHEVVDRLHGTPALLDKIAKDLIQTIRPHVGEGAGITVNLKNITGGDHGLVRVDLGTRSVPRRRS